MLRGINSTMKTLKQVEAIDAICESTYKDLEITEAEYQGKKVKICKNWNVYKLVRKVK